jgi:hypothetical protein
MWVLFLINVCFFLFLALLGFAGVKDAFSRGRDKVYFVLVRKRLWVYIF